MKLAQGIQGERFIILPKYPGWALLAPVLILMGTIYGCALKEQPKVVETAVADIDTYIPPPQLPEDIQSALLPKQHYGGSKRSTHRLDIQAKETPALSFFSSLGNAAGINIVADPNITGSISLSMSDVTAEEILRAVRDAYGFDYKPTAYGYRISPRELQTRIFNVDYLNVKRSGSSEIQVSGGSIKENIGSGSGGETGDSGGGSTTTQSSKIETLSVNDFWSEMRKILEKMVGEEGGRQVFIDPNAGVVLIKAYPDELASVEDFIRIIQKSLQQQVIIEAKIIEVQLNEGYQEGIQWDTFGDGVVDQNNLATAFEGSGRPFAANLTGYQPSNEDLIGGIFGLSFNYKNDFAGFIRLLKTQGDVKVLSSPRISTVNNQKAVIKVGTDEFFVTDVSTQTTATTTTTSQTPDVTLTPFFSGIALDVTPQIGHNNEVILHVHPSVTEVVEQKRDFTIGSDDLSLPLAFSTVRETDSIIRAKSNQVVVIGGLLQNKVSDLEARVPFLSDIPIIGRLFTQKKQVHRKVELVILLKPQVVDQPLWNESIKALKEKFPYWKSGRSQDGNDEVFQLN